MNGVAPDLLVYFGDLAWRAVGTVGGDEGIHTFENDTGPDDANHAQDGLLIMAGPGVEPGRRRACTCSTSRRPCSSCSGSSRWRRCAGRACSGQAGAQQAALRARLACAAKPSPTSRFRGHGAHERHARRAWLNETMPVRLGRLEAIRFQRPGAMRHSSVSARPPAAGSSFAITPPRRVETVSFGVDLDGFGRRADLAGRHRGAQLAAALEPNGSREGAAPRCWRPSSSAVQCASPARRSSMRDRRRVDARRRRSASPRARSRRPRALALSETRPPRSRHDQLAGVAPAAGLAVAVAVSRRR